MYGRTTSIWPHDVEQPGGEAFDTGEVGRIPQLRAPQLQEVGVALDLLDHGLRELALARSCGLLQRTGEGLQRLLGIERVDLLAAEQPLAVGACLLQISAQRRRAADDEAEWQLPALQRYHGCDQQRQGMLAVAVALVTNQLRLVQQQDQAGAPPGECELDGGKQLARQVLLALGAERHRERDLFPTHRQARGAQRATRDLAQPLEPREPLARGDCVTRRPDTIALSW
jgi:hypothetical protein